MKRTGSFVPKNAIKRYSSFLFMLYFVQTCPRGWWTAFISNNAIIRHLRLLFLFSRMLRNSNRGGCMSKCVEGLYIAIRPKGKKVSVITIGTKQMILQGSWCNVLRKGQACAY